MISPLPSYRLPVGRNVRLKFYEILCNEITTFVDNNKFVSKYESVFNALALLFGVFFCQLKAGSFVET